MKERLKVGIIGLGQRGDGLLNGVIVHMEEIDVVAVCDAYEDRAQVAADKVEKVRAQKPFITTNYKELIACEEVEVIIISSSWADHIGLAIEAMKAGKPVGVEVGGAYSVQECWDLVRAYEGTGVPYMLLENCCYGREEMMIMNMIKQGVFGEIVHCEGGYQHDLREEVVKGKENRHYRLSNYKHRNCENYPTHELGPIAQILEINRGNRMLTLTSMASKARGLQAFIEREEGIDQELNHIHFAQGDVVTTIIKCAGGETITLTLDTTLPRGYSRGFRVQGTKGMFMEDNMSIFIDGVHNKYDFKWKEQWNNIEQYREEYEHPVWKEFLTEGVKGGHGGMDWLVLKKFFDCVRKGQEMPIDVYDMASWMVVTVLSEESVAMGGQVMPIPDFTKGRWITRK